LIAACPQCQTRFRLAREKIGPQGARIRCSQCQTVFRVQSPDVAGVLTPTEARPSPVAAMPPPAPVKPLPPLARAVIAEADPELSKGIAELLAQWRIASEIVEDGGDALLQILRSPPQLAILGAGLASLSAPKLSEIVRRSPLLAGVKLVHVAVAAEPPSSGYEACAMIEPADLPAGLGAILELLGIGAKPVSAAPKLAPARVPAATMAATAAPATMPPARPARPVPSSDPDIAAAERLARIAVSDVILYNEPKFAAAIKAGNVVKALAIEIEEARQHFNSRVSPILRQNRDFLREELERRAAQRKT
jgi:predicted Zn finger-like uncharacterized protein